MKLSIMALLLGAAASPAMAATNWAKATHIQVAMADYHYTPNRILLRAGQPYVLRFTNTARQKHDFSADAFFEQARVDRRDRARTLEGRVTLPAGGHTEVRLIAPPRAIYRIHCSQFGHDALGETGEIVVR